MSETTNNVIASGSSLPSDAQYRLDSLYNSLVRVLATRRLWKAEWAGDLVELYCPTGYAGRWQIMGDYFEFVDMRGGGLLYCRSISEARVATLGIIDLMEG
ncbi:MAG: hypothetical protein JSS20_18525 [Proteobacteria bacterium]|nr:hypothetical protein [Pseudomonadota bacterium]